MKRTLLALVCMASASLAWASQDPNVVAAEGSFASGSSVSTTLPVSAPPILSPIPEPDAVVLLAAGVAVAAGVAWRRRR